MAASSMPASVKTATHLTGVVIVLSGLTVLLTWLRYDALVLEFAERNAAAGRILADQGLDALKESPLLPKFVPLAIVSLVVFAPLAGVLLLLLREAVSWARLGLSATVAFNVLLGVQGINRDLPWYFVVLVVASLVANLALLVTIWRREVSVFVARDLPAPAVAPERAPELPA